MQYELNNQCSRIANLENENKSLRQNQIDQTNNATVRLREELAQFQEQFKRVSENKDMMEERYKQNLKNLQSKLEEVAHEKSSLVEEKR